MSKKLGTIFRMYRTQGSHSFNLEILDEDIDLNFLNFKEQDGEVVYEDSSGYTFKLDKFQIEHNDEIYEVQSLLKTKIVSKLYKILAETDNYYIIKKK